MSAKGGKVKIIDIRNMKNTYDDEHEEIDIKKHKEDGMFEFDHEGEDCTDDEDCDEDKSSVTGSVATGSSGTGSVATGSEGDEGGTDPNKGGSYSSDLSSESDNDDESDAESESSMQSGGSVSDSGDSTSTSQLLSSDPLFLVLSQYLVNDKNENIVTVLSKINRNLAKLVRTLRQKKHK
jgi:hypothetical protein